MKVTLRQRLGRTPIGQWLRQRRECRAVAHWSPKDEAVAGVYAAFVGPGSLCFDVGANMGHRTKVLRQLGARVVAVEPQARRRAVLRRVFGRDPLVTVAGAALGEQPGELPLFEAQAHTVASLSPDWVRAVSASGRFGAMHWQPSTTVPVTMLDALIAEHGTPGFIKVDVEGFEEQVVRGLSRPVGVVSLEFTPEHLDSTARAIGHLAALGPVECNYALGQTAALCLPEWTGVDDVLRALEALRTDHRAMGDVYIRFLRVRAVAAP